jgi:hypothetical protein
VGNESHPFEGTFDGKGYALQNWSHTAYDESYQGLFGMAGAQSVIKNLKVDNPSLTSAGAYTGIVVGYSSGVVSNVTVTGATMKHNNSFGGGVIGAFKGTTASNLSFTGTLTGAGETWRRDRRAAGRHRDRPRVARHRERGERVLERVSRSGRRDRRHPQQGRDAH